MCRCGGASEHDHLTKITLIKSLNSFIAKDRTFALNVKNPNKLVEKVLREKYFDELESNNEREYDEDLKSDVDDQIIINIQFDGTVKIKGIEFFGSKNYPKKWPTVMKVFVNSNTPIDFTNVNSIPATQEFNLISLENENADGPIRYSTRAAKFFNVNNLTLLFEKSNGSPFIEINYLGFEGEFVQTRVGAVKAEYEVKPMISDHKVVEGNFLSISK